MTYNTPSVAQRSDKAPQARSGVAARSMDGVRRRGPRSASTDNPQREMTMAGDPRTKRPRPQCECGDSGCPVHKGHNTCHNAGYVTVRRIDMDDGQTRFRMCRGCAQDALDSGVFA